MIYLNLTESVADLLDSALSRYLKNRFCREEGEEGRGWAELGEAGWGVESSEGRSEGGGGKSISWSSLYRSGGSEAGRPET